MEVLPFEYCYHEEKKWSELRQMPIIGINFQSDIYPENYARLWVEESIHHSFHTWPFCIEERRNMETLFQVKMDWIPVFHLVFLPKHQMYQKRGAIQIDGPTMEAVNHAKLALINLLHYIYASLQEPIMVMSHPLGNEPHRPTEETEKQDEGEGEGEGEGEREERVVVVVEEDSDKDPGEYIEEEPDAEMRRRGS